MTQKEKQFADEYLRLYTLGTDNAGMAYKNVSPYVKNNSTASAAASRCMRRPEVAEYIRTRKKEIMDKIDEVAKEEMIKNKLMVINTLMNIIDGNHIASEVIPGGRIVEKKPSHKEVIEAIKIAVSMLDMGTDRVSVEVKAVEDGQSNLRDILHQIEAKGCD